MPSLLTNGVLGQPVIDALSWLFFQGSKSCNIGEDNGMCTLQPEYYCEDAETFDSNFGNGGRRYGVGPSWNGREGDGQGHCRIDQGSR